MHKGILHAVTVTKDLLCIGRKQAIASAQRRLTHCTHQHHYHHHPAGTRVAEHLSTNPLVSQSDRQRVFLLSSESKLFFNMSHVTIPAHDDFTAAGLRGSQSAGRSVYSSTRDYPKTAVTNGLSRPCYHCKDNKQGRR